MSKPRLAAALAAIAFLAPPVWAETDGARQEIVISSGSGEHRFSVEIADDPRERSRGLMYRRDLAKDTGMLFDFGTEEEASMWMANTYLPLDMLFIKADGTVESIAKRTTPLSRRSIESRGLVRYVLEINAGASDELGIKPGDKVSGPALQSAD
jgi:uncharacterized membrane protein (UPF0127 family)